MSGQKPAYYSDVYSNTPGRNTIDIQYTCGTSGAVPTFPSGLTKAVADIILVIVLLGTGVLTITFRDAWERLVNVNGQILQASYSASGACGIKITTNNVETAGTQTLILTFVTAAGAAVNPASGDVVYLTITLQSVVP